ncbi:MAG: T9SS type A sorting domain-containing protein [Chitinophagaceae bacterium]|nr:T9SS type A sorting domain-containing protein [Chitinophagaceae bacterium]
MKKIFYILFFIAGISSKGFTQAKQATAIDPAVKYIKFYPNPAVSAINFEFQHDFDRSYSFQIYNFIGKKILDIRTLNSKLNINLTEYYRGVYIYQLRDKSGKIIESGKFQVIK